MMMTNRRAFILNAGAGAAFTLAEGCRCPFCGAGGRKPVALQLYSIHEMFWKCPEKILEKLAAAGYDGVEFYDFNGKSARELRKLCADAGLKPMGTHLNGDEALVGDALKRTLDYAAEVGFESLVTPHAARKTADEYRIFGRTMGLAAEAAASYGIKVGIHTTYCHFTMRFGSDTAWDMIYREASPLLCQQVDTSNTFHTGTDVLALLRKYPNRHHSIHLKENVPTKEGVFGEPPTDGGQCVPMEDILRYTKTESSLKWHVVEAECNPSSLGPAIGCLNYLKARG